MKKQEKLQKNLVQDFCPVHYSMDEYNWDKIAEQVVSVYENMF